MAFARYIVQARKDPIKVLEKNGKKKKCFLNGLDWVQSSQWAG